MNRDEVLAQIEKRIRENKRGKFTPKQLVFWNGRANREAKILHSKTRTNDELVVACLKLMWKYDSIFLEDKFPYCRSGAYRSSYDIWKHIRRFKPGISIGEIITSIVSLEADLRIQYCSATGLRVIYLRVDPYNGSKEPAMNHGQNTVDEFGLKWEDWQLIANGEDWDEDEDED